MQTHHSQVVVGVARGWINIMSLFPNVGIHPNNLLGKKYDIYFVAMNLHNRIVLLSHFQAF